jgi:deazaflavin-dependent oxidoreductase (nitroreductase family)
VPQDEKSALDRGLQAFAQTPLGGRLFISVFPALDRRLLPLTRGRLSTGLGQPVVLLHVRGARSGIERTIPLLATKRGETIVLIASKAGAEQHPDVEVTMDGRRRPMRARVVEGEERDRLWAMACDNYSGYATYQRRAGDRVIPVVVLEPQP